MASAKFLEEALSTAVDESAVNAIVGTLETQLVNSTPSTASQPGTPAPVQQNHVGTSAAVSNGARQAGASAVKLGVAANGGAAPASFVLNSSSGAEEATKIVATATASVGTATSTAPFVNRVATSVAAQVATAPAVKLVYPSAAVASSTQTQVTTANAVNSRFVTQSVGLPNGTVGPPAPAASPVVVTNSEAATNSSFAQTAPVVAANKVVNAQSGMDQAKPTGTALVIKSGVNNSSQCSSTMTLTGSTNTIAVSTVPGVVTLQTKAMNQTPNQTVAAAGQVTAVHAQQSAATTAIVGGSPQIVPANLQILNVNALRGATPVQAGKPGMAPRVMIGAPQLIGGRPAGQITLQTLQGLAPGTQGHLILKTENGQYQLLRVGPAPSPAAGQPTTATAALAGSTFRVQTINVTNASAVQTQVTALATQGTATVAPVKTTVVPARGSVDQTKEKCRKFLANLLELSSREPKAVERNVRTLIQELVDTKVEPEQFCDRLEKLLNASPQPCLIGFLKKSLPLLRQSMVNNELVIDGIRPPPASVLFTSTTTTTPVAVAATATTTTTATPVVPVVTPIVQPQVSHVGGVKVVTQNITPNANLQQIRPPVQMASAGTQVRVATPSPVRPGQNIQHRVITPMRLPTVLPTATVATSVATTPVAAAVVNKSVMPSTPVRAAATQHVVRPVTQIVRAPATLPVRPGQTTPKATQFTTRPVLAATTQFNQITQPPIKPSVFPAKIPPSKEREKKSFSSSSAGGFMGDDDINDVAAMGGVNLAEESQRILGSTEFVGTQIRSCKDDIFLHSNPLMNKIAQIASKFGLQEPNSDVASLMSHATQERLKDLVEKLAVLAEHRVDLNKADPRYEITQDVRAQLKCLEEIDKAERKRHEEQERELLLRAAKSRTKPEDPEQAKLKAKAKEMQRAEMEELRQREANMTALLAIGPRKKPKLDESTSGASSTLGASPSTAPPMQLRPRVKRVCLRDMLMLMEQERELCRTPLLYKSYLK